MPVPSILSDDDLYQFLIGGLHEDRVELVRTWLDADPTHTERLARFVVRDDFAALGGTTGEPAREDAVDRIVRGVAAVLREGGAETPPAAEHAITQQSSHPVVVTVAGGDVWPPPRLGEYRVVGEIGRGGMGVILEVAHDALNRRAAAKLLNPELIQRPDAVSRFLREARAAAAVEHENVVPIWHVGTESRSPYMVMPLLKGQPLDKLLKREGSLPPAEVVRIGREIAAGLGAAHASGLIHRDMKPANVWLDEATGRAIVLDFGLARLLDGTDAITELGARQGTPAYMAPEVLDGHPADARSDLFALGAILYECATGQKAFPGTTPTAIFKAVALHDPVPPHTLDPAVPAALSALIMKLLAKNPAERFATALEVSAELLRINPAGDTGTWVTMPVPVPAPKRSRVWRVTGGKVGALVVVAFALLSLVIGLWAGGVFRVKTPEGTLVVEVNVPNPDVLVDGKKITVSWDKGGKKAEIRVPAGTREVEVTKDGFAAFGKQVALSEGGVRVLEAHLEPQPKVKGVAGTPGAEGQRAGEERDDNALKLKLCWCPAGSLPGSPPRTIPGFWMGKYELTQSEFALMGLLPSHPLEKGKGDRFPIYYVTRTTAMGFCRKLTELEQKEGRLPQGWAYQLPTDEQWVYACRAGTTTATAFGDKLSSTQANFNGDWPYNGAPKGPNLQKTVAVGSYRPNAWGIHDMHGNVAEFTATPGRVYGGSWFDSGRNCCSEILISVDPNPFAPNPSGNNLGFRVALVRK